MIRMHYAFGGAILAIVLAACTGTGPRPDEEPDLAARNLMAEERFDEAAGEYLRLAGQAGDERAWPFLLAAARALVAGARSESALALLEDGDWTRAPAELRSMRAALAAELALAGGHPARALALLPDSMVRGATPSLARNMRETRARAFLATGAYLEAAREGVALEEPDLPVESLRGNHHLIWSALGEAGPGDLEAARLPPPSPLGGWIELALLYGALEYDARRFEEALRAWETRFPGHPAAAKLAPELLALSRERSTPPAKVALLLPLRDEFAEAARAVRDAFMAAWYQGGEGENPSAVIVRDTSAADMATLVASVAEEGAEFIVGPLLKTSVDEVAELERLAVPMLALNRSADVPAASVAEDLYHFALSPEEEAGQVAERAWSDGHTRAAILAPDSEWGARVAGAFSSVWQRLGGRIAETQYYALEGEEDEQPPDMSAPIEALLNVDESRLRRDEVRRALRRRLHFEPRYRKDADMVFLAGFPREVRQLRPQFKFHRVAGLPLYSTSHVYTGVPDAGADGDLDDIIFGDMPMVLPGSRRMDALRERLVSLWPQRPRTYVRLYAFGLDAHALVRQLRRLAAGREHAHEGYTGRLRLDEGGQVRRHLTWARFEGGLPRPVDLPPPPP